MCNHQLILNGRQAYLEHKNKKSTKKVLLILDVSM